MSDLVVNPEDQFSHNEAHMGGGYPMYTLKFVDFVYIPQTHLYFELHVHVCVFVCIF